MIDPDASISATLAEGGQIFELRNKILKPSPEYLVLIEQRSPGDQQAQQMRALLEPFRARNIAHFEVFYYQTEPSWLTPERGGRAVHIDTVRAFFRNHRLIVMGTGRGFLRSSDLSPLPSVEALKTWGRRAMLTPTPDGDWGRTEPTVARVLEIPRIGRTSPHGFAQIATLLNLERGRSRKNIWTGQRDVAVLDSDLRLRPHRLLNTQAPSDEEVTTIIDELKQFLDHEGFLWLAALAVYPGLQWELTLYLGLDRTYRPHSLYTQDAAGDDRLGRLIQLPWLQAGRMPNWLRVRLIAEMTNEEAGVVYAALTALFLAARKASTADAQGILLRIGRDLPIDVTTGKRLQDEIMLDFMERGDNGAFVLPSEFKPDIPLRLQRLLTSRTTIAAGIMAALASAVLFSILPSGQQPLMTGAWLPLIAFGFGCLVLTLIVRRLVPEMREWSSVNLEMTSDASQRKVVTKDLAA